MKYTVEISADARKDASILSWERHMQEVADEHECCGQYCTHEMEGINRRVVVCDCVLTVLFDDEGLHNMLSLLRRVRGDRLGHIDCVYKEGETTTVLFASARYIRRMPKPQGLAFKRSRKKRNVIDDDEHLVLEALGSARG